MSVPAGQVRGELRASVLGGVPRHQQGTQRAFNPIAQPL